MVQKPSEIGFIIGNEFEKQESNIILIFLELSGFDELIGSKSVWKKNVMKLMRQTCRMGGELGQR